MPACFILLYIYIYICVCVCVYNIYVLIEVFEAKFSGGLGVTHMLSEISIHLP